MASKNEDDSIHQLWDKLFKVVGDQFPKDVVRFVLPDRQAEISGKYEQEKIIIEYQIADINFWINVQGEKLLLNIEPYSTWESTIPAKVFTRNAIITKSLDYKQKVLSVVVILDKKPHTGSYQVGIDEQWSNQFLFPVVSFDDLDEILQKFPCLAPFVLKIDRSYEDKVIAIVKDHKLLSAITVLVLSRLGLPQKEALKMLGSESEKFKQALLEVPIMQDVFKEWEDKGRQEGAELEKKEIAKSMFKEGLAIALIAKITGLKPEEIEQLKQ